MAMSPILPGWSERRSNSARAVDQATVGEEVWQRARKYYSEVELLDMTMLAGFYGLASRVALTLDIEPDVS